ncbi:WD repeat-containing protein 87 [Terramyces sp. JEL0728]|nr:WD repeat-containing protein 87 [Terramyces sp. JEL0728]
MDDLINDEIELTPEELAKLMLPSTTLILPWQTVKKKIETVVANNSYRQTSTINMILGPGSSDEDEEEQHHDDGSALNVSIPTGFQILRTIGPSKLPIKSVMALSQGESTKLGCIDSQFAHIWQGNSHLTKMSIGQTRGNNMDNSSPLSGLDLWIYVPTWKTIIFSTTSLEIKLMDTQFKVLSTISVPKPILCLEFVEDREPYLIVGSIGHITYYGFKNISKHSRNSGMVELDGPKLTIHDLEIDDWITRVAVDKKRELLYAVYENHVNIYNLKSGALLEKMIDIHFASITQILLWLHFGYWITSSKDSTSNETSLTSLKRVSANSIPSRIFGFGSDGSILIISPRTGQKLIISFPFVRSTVIVEGVYDISQNRIYLLTDTGSIMVYTAFFSPCLMAEEWEYTVFQEKVCCMTGLPSQEHFEPILHNNAKLQYFLLICGTDSGQIVTRDVRDQGFQSFVVQAHGAPCTQVLVDEKGEKLTSCSLDGSVKVWKITYKHSEIGEKFIRNTKLKNGRNVYMELVLLSTIQLINTIPEGVAHDYTQHAIGVATKVRETYRLKAHPNEDDHVNAISSMDVLQTLPILVNASIDGVVKVWDMQNNTLIREIQFNDAVSSVIFANPRGDLLVALPIEIVLVQVQDYLPPEYLERLLKFSFDDDELETPEKFDLSSRHWKKHKKMAKQDENPLLWEQLKNMFGIDFDKKPVDIVEMLLPIKKFHDSSAKYSNVFEEPEKPEQRPKSQRMAIARQETKTDLDQIQKKRFFDEGEDVAYHVPELSLERMLEKEKSSTFEDEALMQMKIVNAVLEPQPEPISLTVPVIPPIPSTAVTPKEKKKKKRKVERIEAMELVQRNRLKRLVEEKEAKKKQEQEALKKKKKELDIPRPNAQGLQGPNLNLIKKSREEEEIPSLPKKQGRSRSMNKLLQSSESLPPMDDDNQIYYGMLDDDDFEPIPPVPVQAGPRKSVKKKKKKAKGEKGELTAAEEAIHPLEEYSSDMQVEYQRNVASPTVKYEQNILAPIETIAMEELPTDGPGKIETVRGVDIEGVNFSAEYQTAAKLDYETLAELIMLDDTNDENFKGVLFDKKLGTFKNQYYMKGNYRSHYPKEGFTNEKIGIQSRSQGRANSKEDILEKVQHAPTVWNEGINGPKPAPSLHDLNPASVAWGLFKIALKQAHQKKEGHLAENVVKDFSSNYSGNFAFKVKNARYNPTIKKEIKKPAQPKLGQFYVGIIGGEEETVKLNQALETNQSQANLEVLKDPFPAEETDQTSQIEEAGLPTETQPLELPPLPLPVLPAVPMDRRLLFMPQKNRYSDEKTTTMILDEESVEEVVLKPSMPERKGSWQSKPRLKKLDGPKRQIRKDPLAKQAIKEMQNRQDAISGWNEFNNDLQLQPGKIPPIQNVKDRAEAIQKEETFAKAPGTLDVEIDMMNVLASAPWFPDFSDKSNITVETLVKGLMEVLQNKTMDEDSKVEAALCMRFIEETFETDFQSIKEFVLNAELDLLEVAPAKLQVQIIENLGASKQPSESIMLSLITSLNSKEDIVAKAAIDALGNFGISTKEDLQEAMKNYHMFNECRIFTPKVKFIHPLDIVLQQIMNDNEGKYRMSLDKVKVWRRNVDPRIQGAVVLRPDSSLEKENPTLPTKGP